MSDTNTDFGTPFNVIAAFQRESDASRAIDVLAGRGVPRAAITVHRPGEGSTREEVSELEAEMQEELVGSWGFLSGAQAKRAFGLGLTVGLVGLVLGLVSGLAWAYLFSSGLSRLARVVTATGVVGLAGATVGLVDGGGGLNRRPGRAIDPDAQPAVAERDVLVAVHLSDRVLAERTAALLRGLGAERADFIDIHGVPLPPQAQHPRPADPEGFWWGRAGDG
jgi:hypothetical protein